MAIIPLVSSATGNAPGAVGPFDLPNTLPQGWAPQPAALSPRSLPTPYGRAEVMRVLLAAMPLDGSPAPAHDYVARFRELVLGLATGELRARPVDLADTAVFDNFGRALRGAEPDIRYLAVLTRPSDGLVYGVSHPHCLMWPHARRTQSEWSSLAAAADARASDALVLLCDWRASLLAAGRWNSAVVAWQRGLDWLLAASRPTADLSAWHDDARSAPICLHLASGPDGIGPPEPVFVPSVHRGFARALVARTASTIGAGTGAVQLVDRRGSPVLRVATPAAANGADPVALGSGTVEVVPVGVFDAEDGVCLEKLPHAIASVLTALASLGRPASSQAVDGAPFLYPDVVRVLAHRRLLWSGDGRALRATTRAEALCLGEGGAARLPDPSTLASDPRAFVLACPGHDVLYAQDLGTGPIGDLAAIGYALFQVFVGAASVSGSELRDRDGASLLRADHVRPIEGTADAYERAERGQHGIASRLATLQRFVRAYAGSGKPDLAGLLGRAAATFANTLAGFPVQGAGAPALAGPTLALGAHTVTLMKDGLQ